MYASTVARLIRGKVPPIQRLFFSPTYSAHATLRRKAVGYVNSIALSQHASLEVGEVVNAVLVDFARATLASDSTLDEELQGCLSAIVDQDENVYTVRPFGAAIFSWTDSISSRSPSSCTMLRP